MMRDTWRAVLVLAVILVVRHEADVWQGVVRAVGPPPSGETGSPVAAAAPSLPQQPVAVEAWRPVVPAMPMAPVQGNGYHWPVAAPVPQQPQQIVIQQEERRPLRRVAAALTEVGDSLIGVVR